MLVIAASYRMTHFDRASSNRDGPELLLAVAKCKTKEVVPKWSWVTHHQLKPFPGLPRGYHGGPVIYARYGRHHAASRFSEIAFA